MPTPIGYMHSIIYITVASIYCCELLPTDFLRLSRSRSPLHPSLVCIFSLRWCRGVYFRCMLVCTGFLCCMVCTCASTLLPSPAACGCHVHRPNGTCFARPNEWRELYSYTDTLVCACGHLMPCNI